MGHYHQARIQAKPVTHIVNGETYDFPSIMEGSNGLNLLARQQAGEIYGLEFHPEYPLCVNGYDVGVYTPDARYFITATGQPIIEEVKGHAEGRQEREVQVRMRLLSALVGQPVWLVGKLGEPGKPIYAQVCKHGTHSCSGQVAALCQYVEKYITGPLKEAKREKKKKRS